MCGSVTAAIPRKQTCGCGDGPTPAPAAQIIPRTTSSQGNSEVPSSPSKSTFKVQKPSRPQSRKQSFEPANFERMDMNSVNILPYEQRNYVLPLGIPEGYAISAPPPQMYGYAPQYANMQHQYHPISMQPPVPHDIQTNGFTNGHSRNSSYAVESPVSSPLVHTNGNSIKVATNGGSCCGPKPAINGNSPKSKPVENGGSCCAPKRTSHSHTSSNASNKSQTPEPKVASCCSSKPPQLKEEPISRTPTQMSPASSHQALPQSGMPFNPGMYQQFLPQATVFTYPPTYGSFQNPLQMSAWRQGIRSNDYSQQPPPPPTSIAPGAPYNGTPLPETTDTVHSCSCGDTCQCIGCAAHPYNDATQDYVRSAWSSMSIDPPDLYPTTNNQPQPQSPTAHTPSSTTSATDNEQSLSASDFFFVNYPFSSDGCGGDTMSCPCGDDCQCLGCTIHRQPPVACEGEKDTCLCGDSCECVGCEIHNNDRQGA